MKSEGPATTSPDAEHDHRSARLAAMDALQRGRAIAHDVATRPLPRQVAPSRARETFTDGSAAIVLEARHDPLIFSTWFGAPTATLVDAYFDWSDALFDDALRRQRQIVLISDLEDAEYPNATVRRRLADATEARQDRDHKALVLGNFVILRSTAIRGALTAIGWLSETVRALTVVKNMGTALTRAAAIVEARGDEVPRGATLRHYRRPTRVSMPRGGPRMDQIGSQNRARIVLEP